MLRIRQEVLDQATSWGGIRVGESTAEQDGDASLTFSLPGRNLDAALGSIHRLDATVASTEIDVEPEQVDRSAPSTTAGEGADPDAAPDRIRLKVEIAESAPTGGAGALLRTVMALFSVVGMVATAMWIVNWWRRRSEPRPRPPRQRILDLTTDDPPTQETPVVPHDPWR